MIDKIVTFLVKVMFALLGLAIIGGLWYYAFGRKPSLVLSIPIPEKTEPGTLCVVGPGEVLHIEESKATLYEMANGQAKWSVAFQPSRSMSMPPPAMSPTVASQSTAQRDQPQPSIQAKSDGAVDALLAKRSEKRFTRLTQWAAELNARRATLKTQLQIENFNVEAAKYHAELAEAQAEAAKLSPTNQNAAQSAQPNTDTGTLGGNSGGIGGELGLSMSARRRDREMSEWYRDRFAFSEAIADGDVIFLVHGSQGKLLDHDTGAVKKDVALPANCSRLFRGSGCVFAVCDLPDGTREALRISTADGAMRGLRITGAPSEGRFQMALAGNPAEPVTQAIRTDLSASGETLLQYEVRLLERKITERALPGAPNSALEQADRKTTSAFGEDALVYARALAADTAREANGGRERTDESAYQVALSRPFDPRYNEIRLTVHGHADVFSTRTLDLVTAGHSLIALDHFGKKLWAGNLAAPISDSSYSKNDSAPDSTTATSAQPCIEVDQRLYFFDSAFLTAFSLIDGRPLWRLPIAGISRLQFDGAGLLYASTDATSQKPLLVKVDAKSGKILWQVENYQECIVSERQVYVTREVINAEDTINRVFQSSKAIECRWKLYKLAASDGKPQWEWFQTRRPQQIQAQGRKVALLFADELQVLKSIAY